MKVYRTSREDSEELAAKEIGNVLHDLAESQETVVVGVVGGTSVAGIYEHLKTLPIRVWSKVHIFLADDRQVPITDERSNGKLVYDTFVKDLVDRGDLPKENFHPYIHDNNVTEYCKAFKQQGGRFDLLILSAGEDGHIAGLFPDHTIDYDNECFITFSDSPKPPAERMSATKETLLDAQYAVLVAFGETKRAALEKFLNPETEMSACPAKIVEHIPNASVFTDLHDKE